MLSVVPLGARARIATTIVAAVACVVAAVATVAACLTAPPSDVGTSTDKRPEIIHSAVYPPEGVIRQWPPNGEFLVPVRLPDPTDACRWSDFDQNEELGSTTAIDVNTPCDTSLLDGGVLVQTAPIPQPRDNDCHVLKFIVAHGFSTDMVPDSIEGDIVTWEYEPASSLCNFYDAGALQDGAFPPTDAGYEGLPVTPESGTGDSRADL
jgi:hypothetical protein